MFSNFSEWLNSRTVRRQRKIIFPKRRNIPVELHYFFRDIYNYTAVSVIVLQFEKEQAVFYKKNLFFPSLETNK